MQLPTSVSLSISTYRYSSIVYLRNDRPVLWHVEVKAAEALQGARLRVRHEPAHFARAQEWELPPLAAGQLYTRHGECPEFDDAALLALKDDVPGRIIVELLDKSGELLAQQADDFKWLAFNTWAGGNEYPELLAALTLPHDPAVDAIVNSIGAGNGYADAPEESQARLRRLWEHVAGLGIEYALPPESWIDDGLGQRVRTPSCIVEEKCSTCLDSTLLLAACVARLGLNPFVILTDGHAFLGVQKENRYLPSPQLTPASTIRNQLKRDQLQVLETTMLNTHGSRTPVDFDTAAATGTAQLEKVEDDDYFQALDIKSLWYQVGIHPILGKLPENTNPVPDAEEADNLVSSMPRNRMDVWQLKLLDLSLRNPLLNTQPSGKRHLPLLLPDVGKLEDKLADGGSFRVKPVPETYWSLTSQVQHGAGSEVMSQHLSECVDSMFRNNELASKLPPQQLQKQLQSLYLTTRREMEESGANTLYIACGFLKWYRRNVREQRAFRAPILLLPVRLTRPSVKAGFTLRGSDEEPRMNMTLLELLKTEFGLTIPGLEGELPTDQSGLDVAKIFNIVREAIDAQPGWEVEELCVLGTFSFTKYLMWKDLCDRRNDLLRNPIVSQIAATERGIFPEQVGFPDPATIDNEVEAHKVYTPLSSDSSQLSAVLAAGRGKNFVLIGPPGTGKSQTITNMIAHCLAHGKTVLFVAEKAAALQVVHNRLKRVGLEEFCLELHSNKANKKDVLAQYKAAVEAISAGAGKQDWEEQVFSMAQLRHQLNMLPWELHHLYPDESCLFNDIDLVATHPAVPEFSPCPEKPADLTRAEKMKRLEEARDLALHFELVRRLRPEQCALLTGTEYSLEWEEKLHTDLRRYCGCCETWDQEAAQAAAPLNIPAAEIRSALPAIECAAASVGSGQEALLPAHARTTLELLSQIAGQAAQFRQQKARLSLDYPAEALQDDDLTARLRECKDIAISGFFTRFFGMRRMRRYLQMLAGSTRKPADCLAELQALVRMQEITRWMAGQNTAALPAEFNKGLETTDELLVKAQQVAALYAAADSSEAALLDILQGGVPGVQSMVRTLQEKDQALCEAENALRAVAPEEGCSATWATELLALRPQWRNLVLWNRKTRECHPAWVAPLQDGLVAPDAFPLAVQVNMARQRLRAAAAENKTLLEFMPAIHEGRIADFAAKDSEILKATSRQVRNQLIQRAAGISRHGTEVALLQRELSKQRAHMPLRQLLTSIPNLTPLLKPCMLMSPLSVAQYLTTDAAPFDVVIFDEASQIPVWDAIGAIGRGHNAIIVGDPRQMPPTSFFSRSKDAEDEDDGATEKDMESILDECLACNIPALNLNWHYRSKSESLIAYSNNQYYEQKLTTFPAPRTQDNAVHYHHVKGIYEPGSSKRINLAEATALVAHVVETLRNPDFRYTEASSIGIVTFNTQQQALIEDLLEAERAKDESLEPYFAENNPEAVFVKNLENVQGDERGVIYFSTTFGRDAKGKMSMNFGPLNLMGGERRLNVAITRARTAMHVFTSMMPEDIDLSRTRARGAADLRGFLDYARRGAAAYLELQQGIRLPEKDSLIARLTADLGARGWKCHTNVGVSDYRIDIAVEHPEAPDTVLAGIATDGYSYAAANTARDRDVLRHSVLHILGWRLLRVWAIDWWRNPAACVDALDAALKGFVEAGPLPAPELPLLTAPLAAAAETKAAIIEVAAPAPEQLKPLEGEPYREARLNTTLPPLFEMSDSSLRPYITRFVKEEGPIKESFLMNRLRSHSLTPALSPTLRVRLQEIITWQLERGEYCCRMEGATRVLYAIGTPDVLPRTKGPRNWDDVPDSELRAISVQVLAHLKCISGCDDHLKGIATYLGIGRLTKPLREHLSAIVLTAGQDIVTK
ncbi:MAG: DUF4011 domain-containing protein [Akkermansia sp.]|nr:DUF4011 domain-containing protein [Akkermansia sp.]